MHRTGAGCYNSRMKAKGESETRAQGRGPGLRGVLLALVAVLFCLSVPWYRSDDQPLRLLFGVPDWVAVAVICYVLVAVLNSLAWMRTGIDDDAPLPAPLRARGRPVEDANPGASAPEGDKGPSAPEGDKGASG